MHSSRATTRVPGILYLLLGIPGAISLEYVPATFLVAGDAAATARRVTEAAFTYRLCVLCDLVSQIFYLVLAVTLYGLLKHVDRFQARLLVVLVAVAAAIGLVNEINQVAPLLLLSGAPYLSTFTRPQLESLALAFFGLRSIGLAVDAAFWGLWLLPFGILVFRSGTFPRILGFCLVVGCLGYLAFSVASIAWPAHRHVVSLLVTPLYAVGELPIPLWLLIRGATLPPLEPRPAS